MTLLIVKESGIVISELVIMPSFGPTVKLLISSFDGMHVRCSSEIVGVDVCKYSVPSSAKNFLCNKETQLNLL